MANFELRSWKFSDLDSLVKYANNVNISRFLTDRFPFPYTVKDGQDFLTLAVAHPDTIFAIAIKDEAVGAIGIHPREGIERKNAELGYWLAEKYWGRGIISKAIAQAVSIGFSNLHIDRIFARPFGNNPVSARVLEKNGFQLEARFEGTFLKNGEKLDELVYAIRRGNP